jgi:hypothetical protein
MSRRPSASPWRACGVIWCSVLMTMGCTEPSASPSNTEHKPMAQWGLQQRIHAKQHGSHHHGGCNTAASLTRSAISGSTTRMTAAAMANAPRMEPITDALKPRSWPSTGTTKV